MVVISVIFLLLIRRTSSCISSMIPGGHVQINFHPDEALYGPTTLLNLTKHTFTLFKDCMPGFLLPPRAYLIMLTEPKFLDDLIYIISCNEHRWWPGIWIVISLMRVRLSEEDAELFSKKAIQLLWNKAAFSNAVYIEMNDIVYKADPFAPENECGKEVNSVYSANCSFSPMEFRTKFPSSCELLVSTRDSPPFSTRNTVRGGDEYVGYDVSLVNLLTKTSNLKVKWTERPTPQKVSREIAYMYYGNLTRNEIDIAIGGSVLQFEYMYNVSFAYSHATQYLKFYVPDGEGIRGFHRLATMFTPILWILVILSIVLSGLAISAFAKMETQKSFMYVYSILLEEAVKIPPNLRRLILSIILPFYFLSLLFATVLQSFVVNPPWSPGITTLEELVAANLTVLISDTNKNLVKDVKSARVQKILQNSRKSPGLREAAAMLNRYKNFCLVERDIELSVLVAKHEYAIHDVDYKIADIRNCLVHPKGSKYRRRIYQIIIRCIENGFCRHSPINEAHRKPSYLNSTFDPIKWRDMDSAFYLLFVGLGVALLLFWGEIFFYKWKKRVGTISNCIHQKKKSNNVKLIFLK